MLIAGAKGFAIELLEVFHQLGEIRNIVFFDDVSENLPHKIFNEFLIIKTVKEVEEYFRNDDKRFCLGLGNPIARKLVAEKLMAIGGELVTVISPKAEIGHYESTIGKGSTIMTNTVITNHIKIGIGCLINLSCTIGHGVSIENYVELCPGVNISGNVEIGKNTFIGTNSTVLPNIKIGENVIVAAGSVVTTDIPDNCMIAGVPAIIKGKL